MKSQTRSSDPGIAGLTKILMSHAHKIGVYEHEIDDLIQDTFVRMYGIERGIKVDENIVSLAITTMRRRHFDLVRNKRRERVAVQGMKLFPNYTPAVNGYGIEARQAIALMDTVLSPTEKDDLICATVGYDYKERAAITGWALKSVSTRTGMSRKKLAAAMG